MRVAALVLYVLGLAAEVTGAWLLLSQFRRLTSRERLRDETINPVLDAMTRYSDVMRIRSEFDVVKAEQKPSVLAIVTLFAGIVLGFAGNLCSLYS